jgi:hypothetical protein
MVNLLSDALGLVLVSGGWVSIERRRRRGAQALCSNTLQLQLLLPPLSSLRESRLVVPLCRALQVDHFMQRRPRSGGGGLHGGKQIPYIQLESMGQQAGDV